MATEKTNYDLGREVRFYVMKVGTASIEEVCMALRHMTPLDQATFEKVVTTILETYVEMSVMHKSGRFYFYS